MVIVSFNSLAFTYSYQSYSVITMSIVADSLSNGFGLLPGLDDVLGKKIKHDVEEDVLDVWDKGVFLNELLKQNIVFKTGNNGSVKDCLASSRGLKQGTYRGTRLALTELYSLIEEAYEH